jgi:hypothetical protein
MIWNKKMARVVLFASVAIALGFFSTAISQALEYSPVVTNVTGEGFSVSWMTNLPTSSIVRVYQNNKLLGTFHDDRGKDTRRITHHVTVKELRPNNQYQYLVVNDNMIDNDKGKYYTAVTGPQLIPVGSIQPAGRVLLADSRTNASEALVYVTVNLEGKQSAPLSTYVDKNGYWYLELINARTSDYKNLFRISEANGDLTINAIAEHGSATLAGKIFDNNGGTKLYNSLILK